MSGPSSNIANYAAGDYLILRCRIGVVANPWSATIVVPGHPFLLTIRVPDDACLEKRPQSWRPVPEVGDYLVLRCKIEDIHGEGHVTIDIPGYGPPVHLGVPDDTPVERGSRPTTLHAVDRLV